MLKQNLSQKLQQKLSPQQIQVMAIIECPIVALEERIKEELIENPALEEGPAESEDMEIKDNMLDDESSDGSDDIDFGDYELDDDIPDYADKVNNRGADDVHVDIPYSEGESFNDVLIEQLHMQNITKEEEALGEYIIGNIDDDGYLRRDLSAMVDDLAFSVNLEISEKELEKVLKIIQDFDPAGVGARNLQECLYLQLCRKTPTELVNLEMRIVQDNFEDFQKMNTHVLLKKLDCSEEQLEAALKDLSKLNPKPGNSSSNIYDRVETIIPDFILEEIDGDLVLSLNNGNVPELRVCRKYKDMINDYTSNKEGNKKNKDAVMYIKQKLDSANWFIDAIKQRNETMMTVMQTIVDIQSDYFHSGDDMLLKPMILQTVADRAGCDPTTVSRVTKGKYIQTEFGIIPLKYFFVDSLHAGEGMSTINIKERIRQLLEDENPDKMLRDDEIADILQKEGINIARRTVAKYRGELGIASIKERRKRK